MELKAVAKDVYACLQPDRGLGWSNSGLIARGGAVVVDTFWDLPRTRRMKKLYEEVLGSAPTRVVNTHHNGDHCWGNQLFCDCEIIGHRRMEEGMRREAAPEMLAALASGAIPMEGGERFVRALSDYDFSGIKLTPPTTLVDERMELDLDGLRVDLIYVGPAHTIADLIVHIPERGVLFGGDILWSACTPIGWEGTYDRWLEALDLVTSLAPDIVVPGHGPVTDLSGVAELRRYLEYVRTEATRFYEMGLPENEAARRIDLGPWADWTEPERIVFNVHRVYRELAEVPYDAPFDVTALFREVCALADEREADQK
ncbi:MAG: cyclase [Hyphomicrobiaceae bacterium]|jgi:cyclase